MKRIAVGVAMVLGMGWTARGTEEPEGLLGQFLSRMQGELDRLPEYVCAQRVDRFNRPSAEREWTRLDTLRFEVAMVGNRELYGLPGAQQFDDRPLAQLVGRGTITTGQLGGLAKHVFSGSAARFTFRGESEENGRRAFEYQFDVARDKSSYRLRSGTADALVAFQGAFWIDAVSMDLLRLEVQAYDIPEALGMAEANTSLQYSRVVLDGQQPLLPVAATFTVVGADGLEDRNRTALSGCRQYRVESTLRADAGAADQRDIAARAAVEAPPPIPPGSVLELALDVKLDPRTAALGDPVQARLTRPLRDGQTILLPEGAVVAGRLVRLEQDAIPFPIYEIGLEFHTVELAGATVPIIATLDEAGPASGLLRETRHLAPTFSRKRTTRMDILVREVQRGQGILQWDGRRLPVPQGLRMKWRVEAATPAQAAHP